MSNRRNRTRFSKAWKLRLDSDKLSGFFYARTGQGSELVQTEQLKNNLAEVIKGKDKAKPTALKRRQKTIEYLGEEVGLSQIARNVFVLPNTDFSNRLVRG